MLYVCFIPKCNLLRIGKFWNTSQQLKNVGYLARHNLNIISFLIFVSTLKFLGNLFEIN